MEKIIQIFGLQRSGTNFLHWSLHNNFINIKKIDYSISEPNIIGNIEGMAKFGKPQSIKHLYPTLEYSDDIIGIYKDYDDWLESVKKSGHLLNIEKAPYVYNNWLEEFKNINEDNKLLIHYNEFVENYEKTMILISNKFNLEVKDEIIFPEYYMNKGGQMTNVKFRY